MPNLYWRYRAFDEQQEIREGLYKGGSNYIEVILLFRQQGLQIFDITKITKQQYLAEKGLYKLHQTPFVPKQNKSEKTKIQSNQNATSFIIGAAVTASIFLLMWLLYHLLLS
jgi:hypothetical protein